MNDLRSGMGNDYCPMSCVVAIGVISGTLVQLASSLYNVFCISYSRGEYAYTSMHRASRARSPPPKTKKTQWPDFH